MKRILSVLVFLPGVVCATSAAGSSAYVVEDSQGPVVACPLPDAALQANARGTTELALNVTDDGDVSAVGVHASSGNLELDEAAVRCASQWHANRGPRMREGDLPGVVVWTSSNADSASQSPVGHFALGWPHSCETGRYPAAGGTTRVRFSVATDGRVRNPQVVQSSGNDNLDQAAVSCVGNWLYMPALQNGQAVQASWQASVTWASGNP
jgi:TonB family protein